MSELDVEKLKRMIVRHEGLRLKPYRDTVGKLTIGVGRNLDDNGISEKEAYVLLENDLEWCFIQLHAEFPWASDLNDPRQDVLVSMLFNMGLERLKGFTHMLAAARLGLWDAAAAEMLNSNWAKQVGGRAHELAAIMKSGDYPPPVPPIPAAPPA